MSCSICFDTFNKSTRSPTQCPYCSIQTCRTCLQTYLLNDISDIPRCINPECGHGYNREFLDGELTSTFRLKIYKIHREKVLSDRERARFPSTQEDTHAYSTAKQIDTELTKKMDTLTKSIKEAMTEETHVALQSIHNYTMKLYMFQRNMPIPSKYNISESVYTKALQVRKAYDVVVLPLQKQLRKLRRELNQVKPIVRSLGLRRQNTLTTVPETKKQEFVKACPANDCKGFLSSAWKCGLCDLWSCPTCHEVKGQNRDSEHKCDPNKVLTVDLLNKEAKSCPKCGVQICKIEGCDQMWCTHCNTGFNWRTGKVASGPIHNPHYFEWLRSHGGAPAQGGTPVQGGTPAQGGAQEQNPIYNGPNCDFATDRAVTNALTNKKDRYLLRAWLLMREFQDYGMRAHRLENEEKHRQLRVRYMANEMNEAKWKTILQRYEKDAHFQLANTQLKELFVNATRDLIRQVLDPEKDRNEIKKQVEDLIHYCNTSAEKVSKRFLRKAQQFIVPFQNTV